MTELQADKLQALLRNHYSLFHADLISRAIHDEDIPEEVFTKGIAEIRRANASFEDSDEYVPNGWENV